MTRAREIANVLGGKNVIINGNFDIWQRGTSFTSPSSNDYHADRWKWQRSGAGVVDVTRSTGVPDGLSEYSMSTQVTTADTSIASSDFYHLQYSAEGYDMQRFGFGSSDAQQLTLSFWVRSPVTGIHSVAFRNISVNRAYIAEYTVDVANTWEYKSITITADTTGSWSNTTGAGLYMSFCLASGSNFHKNPGAWNVGNYVASPNQVNVMGTVSNIFALSRVQLEVGSAATEFEHRTIGEELTLCERYYQKSYNLTVDPGTVTDLGALFNRKAGLATSVTSLDARLTPRMRTNPTVTIYSPATGTSGVVRNYESPGSDVAAAAASIGNSGFYVGGTGSIGANFFLGVHYTADAEL